MTFPPAAFAPGTVVPGFLDGGTWSASFGLSWSDLFLHDAVRSARIMRENGTYLRKTVGPAGLSEGRNSLCALFLDGTDGEWLWMVDTDMGFAPDTVDRLVASADPVERPVMGALCFALRHLGPLDSATYAERYGIVSTLYSYRELVDEIGFEPAADWPRDEVVEVSGTGAACLLIHRGALEAVQAKYGRAWFDPAIHPTGVAGGRRVFSEDLSFCVRLAACGIPVHVDTAVKTSHHKGSIYLTEQAYDEQMIEVATSGVRDSSGDQISAEDHRLGA